MAGIIIVGYKESKARSRHWLEVVPRTSSTTSLKCEIFADGDPTAGTCCILDPWSLRPVWNSIQQEAALIGAGIPLPCLPSTSRQGYARLACLKPNVDRWSSRHQWAFSPSRRQQWYCSNCSFVLNWAFLCTWCCCFVLSLLCERPRLAFVHVVSTVVTVAAVA